MTRMEAIRRQYQGSEEARPAQATCGRPYPARPRHRFWLFFWAAFLFLLIGGFLWCRQPILEKVRGLLADGKDQKSPVASVASDRVGVDRVPTESEPRSAASAARVTDEAFVAYVNPTLAEINQLCEYVRNSPHVRENQLYLRIMNEVQFLYQEDNNAVNAFASRMQLDKSKDALTRVIVYLGGAARFGRVAALAVAAEQTGTRGAGKRFVAALQPKDFSNFSNETAARVVSDAGLLSALGNESVVTKAKSISAGLMLGIIAHEAGHQALGHVHNTAKKINLEVSRNQEREADSFASSVIASSPFGEYILVGTLFWHYALAQQEGVETVATTHPLSRERFENFVRANADLAASMGIAIN